ncbi:MAG: Gfo/Idh/MocA family oxidoreductase [Acidobacteriota bacterium]|nr:MAG: Gfo/Idh/MocA family oxidoreductase [Acidobacteriota bacterium]
MNKKINRREFVGASIAVTATAASYSRILGANDRISIGIIGCGDRGRDSHIADILNFQKEANVQITAVCDPWRQMREKAAQQVKTATGSEPTQLIHYEELLQMEGIDAVTIGTPEHQHCTQLTAAARLKKDAYVEKPLAMNMEELILAVDTVIASGCIVQNGTQIRSLPQSRAAKQFIAEGGLGKVLKAAQARNGYKPYWFQYAERPIREEDVDWKAFLMHLEDRPFDPDQYAGWYGYREFCRGPHTTQGLHFIDTVHYITGASIPRLATAHFGTYRWKDHRTVPDSVEMIFEYPEDFVVRYGQFFGNGGGRYNTVYGTRGSIDCSDWSWDGEWPVSGDGTSEPDKIQPGMSLPKVASVHHMKNWLDCLRSRKQPNAPMEAGYAHAVAGIMADESYVRGKRMGYDPEKRALFEA